jgi:hypothetical protein
MKQKGSHGFQPCPFSADCLRLLDDLDSPNLSQRFEEVFFIHTIEDERLLDQLRLHVPDCPTCTALVRNARCLRARQRSILYHLLQENESKVPSTTPQIFAAIRQEQNGAAPNSKRMYYYLEELVVSPGVQNHNGNGNHNHVVEPTPSNRSRRFLRNAFSLATVAALIFAAIGLFGHMFVSSNSPTPLSENSSVSTDHPGWNSVVISVSTLSVGTALRKLTTIYNYDPATKSREQLLPSFPADAVQLDGIPHEGQNLLYHYLSNGHMQYRTLQSVPETGYFYQLNATDLNAGNAIWMDRNHVFIANGGNGVVEVDTQTGRTIHHFSIPQTVKLAFYHSPNLYYVSSLPNEQGIWSTLYRVNTAMFNDRPHKISMRSPGSSFWLSPDGTRIYYLNKGSDGDKGIYAVSIDGTHSSLLRRGDITPIGYAQNNSVMFMREVNNKFQVVQLDNTSKNNDTVVMNDVAPGAISLCDQQQPSGTTPICDGNIALAPYGQKLILNAYYPGGKHKILYDDLTTNQSSVLLPNLNSNMQVQLPGWDKMSVPGIGSSPTLVPTTVQPSTPGSTAAVTAYSPMIPVLRDRHYAKQYAY